MKYLTLAGASLCLIGGNALAQEVAAEKQATTLNPIEVGANLHIVEANQLGNPVVSVGIGADYKLTEMFSVGATADYWSDSSGTLAKQSVTISDMSAGANAKMRFDIESPKVEPYAMVGLALHRFAVTFSEKSGDQSEVIDEYEQVYSSVEGELGADLAAGVTYALQQNLGASAEVKYRNIVDPNVDLDQIAIGAGIRYRL